MSSHREAPEVSKDPVVDSTDTYAFVSPDNPETVTIISNYIPAEVPAGGPTFFEFGNDVLYTINIDNNGDGYPDIVYEFTFNRSSPTPAPSSTTRDRSARWSTRTGTNASCTASCARTATATTRSARTWDAHRATSGHVRRRNTQRLKKKRSTRCRAAGRCSPASATTRSSSTSDRSSTSPTCARSRTCT